MSMPPSPSPRIGIGHGLKWLLEAFHVVRHWPLVFLPMGLIVAIISVVPFLGGLAIMVMGPALLAGIVTAADTARRGRTPAIQQLFAMFQEPTQRNEALKLCLPLVIGKFAAGMVVVGAVLGIMSQSGISAQSLEGHPEKVLELFASGDVTGWLVLAVAIVLLAWTFAALAIPRVALGREAAFKAMKHGFSQVWGSIGAWFVAIILLFAGLVLLSMLLMLTGSMVVMQVGLYTVLYAVLGPLLHAAWHDLGGHVASGDGDHRAPPPPTPPPPSGVLEA